MKVARSVVLVLGLVVACKEQAPPAHQEPAGSGGSPTPAATTPTTTSSLPAAPPLAEVRALTVRIEQGGPSVMECNGIVAEYAVDLEQGTWTSGYCAGAKPGEPVETGAPLTTTSGTLSPAQRKLVVDKYATLAPQPTTGGNDGGPVTITILIRSGQTVRFVDLNWRHETPAPASLTNLRAFAAALGSALHDGP